MCKSFSYEHFFIVETQVSLFVLIICYQEILFKRNLYDRNGHNSAHLADNL